jgi:hypothetical protein
MQRGFRINLTIHPYGRENKGPRAYKPTTPFNKPAFSHYVSIAEVFACILTTEAPRVKARRKPHS